MVQLQSQPTHITWRHHHQKGIDFTYVCGPVGAGKSTWIKDKMEADERRGIKSCNVFYNGQNISATIADMKAKGITKCYVEVLADHAQQAVAS
jgi:ABC-type ATPase involved in cell division